VLIEHDLSASSRVTGGTKARFALRLAAGLANLAAVMGIAILLLGPAAAHADVVVNAQQCFEWMEQYSLAPYRSWGSTPADVQRVWDASDCNHKICQVMRSRFGVVPYHSWGSLPPRLQQVWDTPQVDCNHHS
jgi:hypothetical protein